MNRMVGMHNFYSVVDKLGTSVIMRKIACQGCKVPLLLSLLIFINYSVFFWK